MIFDKLIQVLVFGCGYRRIADASCSATTLRRRRDEWTPWAWPSSSTSSPWRPMTGAYGLEPEHLAIDGFHYVYGRA